MWRASGRLSARNHRNRKQKIKMEDQKKYRDISHELSDWLQEFRDNLVDEALQQSVGETQSKEIKTLPSHLMNFQWSRDQKWNQVRVNTV